MQVLKKAPDWTHIASCKGCKSCLKIVTRDLRFHNPLQLSKSHFYIRCINCREHNIVSASIVPDRIKRRHGV